MQSSKKTELYSAAMFLASFLHVPLDLGIFT